MSTIYSSYSSLQLFVRDYIFKMLFFRVANKSILTMTSSPISQAGFPSLKKDDISGSIHLRAKARGFLETVINRFKSNMKRFKDFVASNMKIFAIAVTLATFFLLVVRSYAHEGGEDILINAGGPSFTDSNG